MQSKKNSLFVKGEKYLLLLLFFVCFKSYSQIDKRYNLPNYDDKKIHFGYSLGLNYSTFRLKHSEEFLKQDTVREVYAVGKSGFEVGFIFNLRLGEYFDARVLPKVAFYERGIVYLFKNSDVPVEASFQSSIIEIPLLLKYKSHRRDNLRLYMIGGLKPGFEVGAKKRQKRNSNLATNGFSLSLDYGIGLDLYYPLFKLSPELRFSMGLLDVLRKDDNMFSRPIERMTPYNLTFAILFE